MSKLRVVTEELHQKIAAVQQALFVPEPRFSLNSVHYAAGDGHLNSVIWLITKIRALFGGIS
jgi:phage baseplate assembly protein W